MNIKRKNIDIVKRFFEPIKTSNMMRRVAIRAMFHPLLSGFITIAIVEIMRGIVDHVEIGNIEFAKRYLWYFIGLVLLWLMSRAVSKNRGYAEFRPKGYNYFYRRYLSKYVRLDNNAIEMIGTGRAQHIIDSGIRGRIFVLSETTIKLSKYFSKILFGIIFVFTVNIYYGVLFIFLVGCIIIIYIYTQAKANQFRRHRKALLVERSRDVVRIIMSKFEVLQSGKLFKDLEKYDYWLESRLPINRNVETQRFISEGFSVLMIDGIRTLAIISMVFGLFNAYLSIADFVSIVMIAVMLDEITRGISRYYIDSSKDFINVEKLRDLFDSTDDIEGYEEGREFSYKEGNISLENIYFGYDKENMQSAHNVVFENFSIDLKGGSKTAFVGVSGSGKSTLVKLISGYLRPNEGSIFVDGQDLLKTSLKSYYNHIGYLTQEPSVFDGTIIDNLTYSIKGKVRQEQLEHSITLAKCDFVWELPNGIKTEIGERGIRLSGGQRQRLAIAKIFLKDPEIIILDEPTSALDSFSEESITQAMNNLFEGRTVIIIAHRLQTVKNADDIIVIEEGKVIERGNHKELIMHGGAYAKMLELQSAF